MYFRSDTTKSNNNTNEEFATSAVVITENPSNPENGTQLGEQSQPKNNDWKESVTLAENIAKQIMDREDRIRVLLMLLDEFPHGLSRWLSWIIKANEGKRLGIGTTDICIAEGVEHRVGILPGDLVIRKQSQYPKAGDIVEICIRTEDEYITDIVKVARVQMVENAVKIQDLTSGQLMGDIALSNIMCVFKIIRYGSIEWISVVKYLDIECNPDYIISQVQETLNKLKAISDDQVPPRSLGVKNNLIKILENRINELNAGDSFNNKNTDEFKSYI